MDIAKVKRAIQKAREKLDAAEAALDNLDSEASRMALYEVRDLVVAAYGVQFDFTSAPHRGVRAEQALDDLLEG